MSETEQLTELQNTVCFAYTSIKGLADQLWLHDKDEAVLGIAWLVDLVGEKLEQAYKDSQK